ncbi:MFS transporter [Streptantibioticus parmotrematis]|uniref:MFS transporter n=1 Tax=Streptantibioticus parmotrematis TaxID=2873249 RepID=UPI0033E532A2
MSDGSKQVAAADDAAPAHGMTESQIQIFSLGALAAMLLSLLDENIVSTAAWPIAKDLDPAHGLSRLPWLIAAYVLSATATQPLYGKLSDMFGPKKVYLFAITAFLGGSALCGFAQSMGELIAFRAVQGLGGGGLMSLTLIILATLMPPRERAGGSGMGGGVVALGIVVGPLLGGFLCQHLSWRWIFYVNLPLGILTIAITLATLHIPARRTEHRVDLLGAALVTAGATGLLLVARWGGTTYGWSSPQLIGYAAASVALLVVFGWWETRVAEPILPLSLFRQPVFRVGAPLQFIGGFAVLAVPVYVVTYLQITRGVTAEGAGVRLVPMAAGVIAVMFTSGKIITRLERFKPVLLVNSVVAVVALALFGTINAHTSTLEVSGLLVLLGFGLGGVVQVVLQTVQAAAEPERLGVTTSGTRFFMTLGSAFGTTVLGEILNHRLNHLLPGGMTGAPHAKVAPAYASATSLTFLVAAGLMVVALGLAFLIPDVRLDPVEEEEQAPQPSAAPLASTETEAIQAA